MNVRNRLSRLESFFGRDDFPSPPKVVRIGVRTHDHVDLFDRLDARRKVGEITIDAMLAELKAAGCDVPDKELQS